MKSGHYGPCWPRHLLGAADPRGDCRVEREQVGAQQEYGEQDEVKWVFRAEVKPVSAPDVREIYLN
jgi:hypothetical protein